MLRDDTNDGFDTVQWIGRQPWFDGNLGTVGGSYDGGTQYALAISNPPYLKAMIPAYAMSDCGVYGIRHHGAFELRWMNWTLLAARDSHYPAAGTAIKNPTQLVEEYAKGLPLHAGATLLSLAPDYESWLVEAMNHGDDDKYWKEWVQSVMDHVAEVKDVPILHISGWYEPCGRTDCQPQLRRTFKIEEQPAALNYGALDARRQFFTFAGEAEFGPDVVLKYQAYQLPWFDHWLKGVEQWSGPRTTCAHIRHGRRRRAQSTPG